MQMGGMACAPWAESFVAESADLWEAVGGVAAAGGLILLRQLATDEKG